MARQHQDSTISFRPTQDTEGKFFDLKDRLLPVLKNKKGSQHVTFSSIFNALLPAIHAAVVNTTEIDEETNEVTIELNIGKININK